MFLPKALYTEKNGDSKLSSCDIWMRLSSCDIWIMYYGISNVRPEY